MTPEGFKILVDVLRSDTETWGAQVRPEPQSGEDVRDIEISGTGLAREEVLRVLGKGGLMRLSQTPHNNPSAPLLGWHTTVGIGTVVHGFRDSKAA